MFGLPAELARLIFVRQFLEKWRQASSVGFVEVIFLAEIKIKS